MTNAFVAVVLRAVVRTLLLLQRPVPLIEQ